MDPKEVKLAKRLAKLILQAGDEGAARLGEILTKILAGKSAGTRREFLKQFHKSVLKELKEATLVVESAHELPSEIIDQLVAFFAEEKPPGVETRIVPDLIAGIRVRLGDSVYDASLAYNLQTLATRLR